MDKVKEDSTIKSNVIKEPVSINNERILKAMITSQPHEYYTTYHCDNLTAIINRIIFILRDGDKRHFL